jgi:hypothetical protein
MLCCAGDGGDDLFAERKENDGSRGASHGRGRGQSGRRGWEHAGPAGGGLRGIACKPCYRSFFTRILRRGWLHRFDS